MTMRRIWVQVHLWLGLTLGVIGMAVGLTGTVLLYENEVDAMFNPQRYAVSGGEVSQPYAAYIANAAQALQGKARPALVRLPQARGVPVTVIARAAQGRGSMRVYLDPPTARVLDVSSSPGIIGWTRQLHEYLLMREFSGREIVGVVGFGMLVSALSGLYLWWPARRRFREALGFRKGLALTRNLHYVFGFYGMLGLAALSFSGIFLAYPEGGRHAVAALAAVSPSARSVQAVGDTRGKRIDVDRAAGLAREAYPNAAVVGIGLPMGPRGTYRIGMNDAADSTMQVGGNTVVFVHPVEGSVLRRIDARSRTAGDTFLVFQRALHAGALLGPVGRLYFALVGILPALFVVTGAIMWLRRRSVRARAASRAAQPA
jgi:uncharacterized iron-regulated membrane protein